MHISIFNHTTLSHQLPQLTIVISRHRHNTTCYVPRFFNVLTKSDTVPTENRFLILAIKNRFDDICAYTLFWLIFILSPLINIRLWQPRYKWINDSFYIRRISSSLPIPNFKTVLFGDGFLQEMNTSKPFWLDTHSKSKRSNYILPNDLIASIYHFKLLDQSCPFDYSSLSFCIPKKTLRTYIHNLFTSYIHVLDKNEITLLSDKIKFYRNETLIVLPTTSF